MKKLRYSVFIITLPLHGWFGYDRAVSSAQHEQWQQANEQFKQLVTQQPDRPDILYDAGVAAYKVADFDQAHAYFQSAAEHETADRHIKEQAYFNAGNAQVQLKKLKEALMHYDPALMLDPDPVAVEAQLDPLVDERLGGPVEAPSVLEVAVERHPRGSPAGEVEADRRQRPGGLALDCKALGDNEVPACVAAGQRDPIAPIGV